MIRVANIEDSTKLCIPYNLLSTLLILVFLFQLFSSGTLLKAKILHIRNWNDFKPPSDLTQILPQVAFIVNRDEIDTCISSTIGPRQVDSVQIRPFISSQSHLGTEHSQTCHWNSSLDKFKSFECKLAAHVGLAVE